MGREEVVRSHVACPSTHHRLRIGRCIARLTSLELEEVVHLLTMLLVLGLVALLVELGVTDFAVP